MSFRDSKLLISKPVEDFPGAFELKFPQSYYSNGKDSLALYQLTCYYSWFNITDQFQNRQMAYIFGGQQYDITFPEGFYTVEDLNNFLHLKMKQAGHYLVNAPDQGREPVYFLNLTTNPTYYAITLSCESIPAQLPSGWTNPANMPLGGSVFQLVVPHDPSGRGNWGDLIGFTPGTYPPVAGSDAFYVNSNKTPAISPITSILVHCDWLSDTRFSLHGDILDSFNPDKSFGSLITYTPPYVLYVPAKGGSYDGIRIRFTDQLNRPLRMRDTNDVLIALSLRTLGGS